MPVISAPSPEPRPYAKSKASDTNDHRTGGEVPGERVELFAEVMTSLRAGTSADPHARRQGWTRNGL
jgi:hypothetical protein